MLDWFDCMLRNRYVFSVHIYLVDTPLKKVSALAPMNEVEF